MSKTTTRKSGARKWTLVVLALFLLVALIGDQL